MIFKTKVKEIEEDTSGLSDIDKENYNAKKEYLGMDFPETELLVNWVMRDAIIDISQKLLYVDVGNNTIQLKQLFPQNMVEYEDGSIAYPNPIVTFIGNLDDIYKKLIINTKK
ncbi:MAG: hypothetical protein LBM02_09865 [Lachnospiraceae bacterium]|jgi:hypothetical protein|nr:hypothetical protein [Lachnospiraceae bacterium]